MASIRDKLKALYTERPTELPDGAPTKVEASEAAPKAERPRPAPAQRSRPAPAQRSRPAPAQRSRPAPAQRSRPAPAPQTRPEPQREHRSPPQPSATQPKPAPSKPAPSKPAPQRPQTSTGRPKDPRRPHAQSLGHANATVVRRSDFEAWKQRRNTVLEERVEPLTPPARAPAPAAPAAPQRRPDVTPEDRVQQAKVAQSGGDMDKARALLESALDAGLHAPHWWRAARSLAELYVKAGLTDQAIGTLELLVAEPSADPYPFLALSDLLREQDPERADALMARARSIAPWL